VPEVSARTARKRALAARWLRGRGIEIGALHNPLPVPPAASVTYVDRLSVEALRQQYPTLAHEAFMPVDVIGDAQDLSAFGTCSLDFVIANHLVEHLEDPIRGLGEMLRVLMPGGVLYLAVPDPRNTFDRNRPLTTMHHVIADYRNGTEASRQEHFREWVDTVEVLEQPQSWSETDRANRAKQLDGMDYSIHFHVWRPDTFIELLIAARQELGLQFELAEALTCEREDDNEFIFVLLKEVGASPPLVPTGSDAAEVGRLRETLQRATHDREEAAERAGVAEERLTASRAQLEALYLTRSWRVTKPLRWIGRQVRRGAQR